MPPHPLDTICANDPALFDEIKRTRDLALTDGVLSAKQKLLIAMALDAAHGAIPGIRGLAQQAMEHGATKAEIMETLRVVNHICGVGSMYASGVALQEIW